MGDSPRSQPQLRRMFVYYALLLTLTPIASLAANPARMSSSWASKRERQHAKQVQESRKSAKVPRQEESGAISQNVATVELYEGEFEALGYPNTLAIYLSAEASEVQGGRGGVFQQTNTTRHHRPVWKQTPGDQRLFFSDFGHWIVGKDPSGNLGGLGSAEQGLDLVPAQGWKFFTMAKEWKYDAAITVKQLEEADIVHIGSNEEGEERRQGLYIKQGSHRDSSSQMANNPIGFSNMVMHTCKSIPKSTLARSIPSLTYSSCSRVNMCWLKNCCNFSLTKLIQICSNPL